MTGITLINKRASDFIYSTVFQGLAHMHNWLIVTFKITNYFEITFKIITYQTLFLWQMEETILNVGISFCEFAIVLCVVS